MISILIVDDHYLIREGLKKILDGVPEIKIAGEADKAGEAMDFIRHFDCDVVILDMNLPDRNGLDVIKDMLTQKPTLQILILSIFHEDLYAERAIRAGAAGYITKDSAPEELAKAIRRVAGGRRYISEAFSEKLASRMSESVTSMLHENLSDREFQIMMMLGSGKNASQSAREINLSASTVNTYKSRIFKKMQFSQLSDLIAYVRVNHLLK
jgi:DNA-binding NarL/FixJ family response regulator